MLNIVPHREFLWDMNTEFIIQTKKNLLLKLRSAIEMLSIMKVTVMCSIQLIAFGSVFGFVGDPDIDRHELVEQAAQQRVAFAKTVLFLFNFVRQAQPQQGV